MAMIMLKCRLIVFSEFMLKRPKVLIKLKWPDVICSTFV